MWWKWLSENFRQIYLIMEHKLQKYRFWYARLLRFYSKSFYQRFGEGMEQTFNDLLSERVQANKSVGSFVAGMFLETLLGVFKENITFIIMEKKNVLRVVLGTALILMIPLIAMQFSKEVQWGVMDFIVIGILLLSAGFFFEWVAKQGNSAAYKAGVGLSVLAGLLLMWMNLAVGIIGDEGNPANLMFIGILAIGLGGLYTSHFKAEGLMKTLFVMAGAQMLVGVIAILAFAGGGPALVLSAGFAMIWFVAGLLFRQADDEENSRLKMV
jgi:hypothetical protein